MNTTFDRLLSDRMGRKQKGIKGKIQEVCWQKIVVGVQFFLGKRRSLTSMTNYTIEPEDLQEQTNWTLFATLSPTIKPNWPMELQEQKS
jgi:hypothetical protein